MATRRVVWGFGRAVLLGLLAGSAGCTWDRFNLLTPPEAPKEAPTDSFVLRPDGLVPDKVPAAATGVQAQLATARELFRREQYAKAEEIFNAIGDNKKNPPAAIQEALYYRAECLRLQGDYPKAADLYVDLLNKFSHTPYREQAVQHMYDIADYWLNDTRQEMREDLEKREGKRWVVWPRFLSFEKSKPFLDREGRALEKLEQVRLHDAKGPLADHALFMCGTVKLYHENYRDADLYFTEVANKHKDSPLAAKAVELAIYCKHMSTGGSDYDGRKVAEARKLVQVAFDNYPTLAEEKRAFLLRQLDNINLQQAEKEFKMAEFWQRTGHPGSAYFYYEMVRRRYPGTKYANLSVERMNLLRAKVEKEQRELPSPPAPGAGAPAAKPAPAGPAGGVVPASLPAGGLPGGPGR
jgi:outer membrane protein assembly factor BamD (BamD/ComL family)